jgi:hypothetical protein
VYSPNAAHKTTGTWAWRYNKAASPISVEDGAGNHFIDPNKAIKKLLRHGLGLFVAQLFIGITMIVVAIYSDWKYGFSVWYSERVAGVKLVGMQYAWAIFNLLSGLWGLRAYLAWKEPLGLDRGRRLLSSKIQVFLGYFTWSFGIWTTAVLFGSFKDYTMRDGVYPLDLTILYCIAIVCCTFGGLWCVAKLLSLGAYTARLAEEWRLNPHGQSAGIVDPDNEQELAAAEVGLGVVAGERKMSAYSSRKSGRRYSAPFIDREAEDDEHAPSAPPFHHHQLYPDEMPPANAAVSTEVDGVLLPHEFERLWNRAPLQGSFSTATANCPTQDEIVAHLTDQGFQVVAAGTTGRIVRVMLCAREAADVGAWFLAELVLVAGQEGAQLDATFKSENSDIVPTFVQSFRFHRLFGITQ